MSQPSDESIQEMGFTFDHNGVLTDTTVLSNPTVVERQDDVVRVYGPPSGSWVEI